VVAVQFTSRISVSLDLIKAFYSADEFDVRGLSTRNRDSGLGAPLIAVTDKFGRFQEPGARGHRFPPRVGACATGAGQAHRHARTLFRVRHHPC